MIALGRAIAAAGRPLVYGGGRNGLMGIVSGAAADAGGRVTGVVPYAFVAAGGEGDKTGAPAPPAAARIMDMHDESPNVRGCAAVCRIEWDADGWTGAHGHRRLNARAQDGDGAPVVWFRHFARRIRYLGGGICAANACHSRSDDRCSSWRS
jgi:hypothetical protein